LAARPSAGLVRCAGRIVIGEHGEERSDSVPNSAGLAGTFAARRDVFDASAGYDALLRYGENTELCFRLTHACRVRGLLEYRTDRAVLTVERGAGETYPPEVLLTSALRVLTRDDALLKGAPGYRANLWGIAGVNAARLGDVTSARRYLVRAAMTNPLRARAWVRAVAAFVPGVAQWRWSMSKDH